MTPVPNFTNLAAGDVIVLFEGRVTFKIYNPKKDEMV
jgi:hypothetical protein